MAEDWVEKRQRAAKCKIHGLHYDPTMTSGCTLCRKEGLEAVPRQKPQLVLMLLSLLGVAVILYRIFGPGDVTAETPMAEPVEDSAVAAAAPSRLDAEDYRSVIREVETALFETPEADFGVMSSQITLALRQLSRRLAETPTPESRAAIGDIDEMSRRLNGRAVGLDVLRELRNDWIALRRRHFGSELWFVQLAAIDQRTDRAALTIYRDVASELVSLVDESSSRAQDLSRPAAPNSSDPEDEAARRAEWQGFLDGWRRQVEDLRRRLPERPSADSDPQVLLAAQRLEQAFAQVSSLASTSALPAPDRLDDVFQTAERARESFEDLLTR